MAIAKVILNGETLMDVTSDTATANNMLSGIQATKNDGTKVTGNIASKSSTDLTASGATVTAPAGYYANAASKAVATATHPSPTATIASSTGVVTASHTQGTGYVTGGTTTGTLNLTTQAGKTVTPTESAQTAVASYRWTTGPISVAAISSTYVGTGVTTRSAADLTASGSNVTAPAGYYSSGVSKSVGAGTAFTPAVTITKAPTITLTASTGVVTATYNGSSSITPTVTSGYVGAGTAGTVSTTGTSTYQLTMRSATDMTVAAQSVTAPAGYYSQAFTKAVTVTTHPNPTAAITSSTGVVTATHAQTAGYVSAGTTTGTTQLTSQAAATYYPSTADQTIASQRWLTGTQTIKSVTTSNLTAENIAEGVVVKVGDTQNASRITQVTGTYKSGGYTCTITGSGNSATAAVQYISSNDNTEWYYGANTITYGKGDSFRITAGSTDYSGSIYVNNELVSSGLEGCNYTLIPNYDFSISLSVSGHQCSVYITIPSINISENGNYDVADYGYANVNVKPTHTITITTTGGYVRCVVYNNIRYYTAGQSFQVTDGESIELYNESTTKILYINGERVSMTENSYIFTPSGNVEVDLTTGYTIKLAEPVIPSGTLSITSNASYNVYGYSMVDVNSTGEFYSAYKDYATGVSLYQTSAYINEWFNSLSRINAYMFAGREIIGVSSIVTFSQASLISVGAFGRFIGGGTVHNTLYSFPVCESVGKSAFFLNIEVGRVNMPVCTSIDSNAFYSCTYLLSINIPNCLTIGEQAFYSCRRLSSINCSMVLSISNSAFESCYSLTTMNCPSCTTIRPSAFGNCLSLTTINFPVCTSIGSYAFNQCQNIITASFPACTSIGSYAFNQCQNIITASFPACTSIGSYAFRSCYNLLSLYLLGSSIPTLPNVNVFLSTPISTYTTSTGGVYGSIFVPASLYDSYITATNWSAYSSRFVSVQGGNS